MLGKGKKGSADLPSCSLKSKFMKTDFLKKGMVTNVTWICVQIFLLCDCNFKKTWWNGSLNKWFATLDVTSKKCQRKRWLITMNNRQFAFYFLLFFYFLVFFVICRLWGLVCVFHGVPTFRSGTRNGMLFSWRTDDALEVGGWR